MSRDPMERPAVDDAGGLTRAELLRRAAGGAALLSAGGLLAACGSSGSSASTPTSGSSVGTGKAKAGGHLRIGATGGGAKDSIDAHLATADTDIRPRVGSIRAAGSAIGRLQEHRDGARGVDRAV
jgi:hypothetical protein